MADRKGAARINVIMISVTLMAVLLLSVKGKAEENQFNSQGKIVFDNRTEDTDDDVIFDARRLKSPASNITSSSVSSVLLSKTIFPWLLN